MSSVWFDSTELSLTTSLQGKQGVQGACALVRGGSQVDEVQAHRTSSNLLELHPHRDSKVYRLLSHEFGVVQLYRTFSNYISSGDTRCAGCSKFPVVKSRLYIDFFHMSSGWFDCTEPSPTTSLQGIQGVQGAICTGSGRFKHIEPHRTFSNYILTEIARYIEFFYTSSGWFDWTKPSLTTSLQGIQGVQGAICTSWMRFKHIEPHRTFSNSYYITLSCPLLHTCMYMYVLCPDFI